MTHFDSLLFGVLAFAVFLLAEHILNGLRWHDDFLIVLLAYVLAIFGLGGLILIFCGWVPGYLPCLLMALFLLCALRLRPLVKMVRHGP